MMGRSEADATSRGRAWLVGAAVVEHRVAEDLEACGLQRRDAPLQRIFAAVRAVQVVQVPRPAISTAGVSCVPIAQTALTLKSPRKHAGLSMVVAEALCVVTAGNAAAMTGKSADVRFQHLGSAAAHPARATAQVYCRI